MVFQYFTLAMDIELLLYTEATGAPHCLAQLPIRQQSINIVCQRVDIFLGAEQASYAIFNCLANATAHEAYHRRRHGLRLKKYHPQALSITVICGYAGRSKYPVM